MEGTDEDTQRALKVRLLLQSQIDRKKKREKEKEEVREAAKRRRNLGESNEERGDSSTSSVATVTDLRSKKKVREAASKSDFVEKFKAVTENLYDKIFKAGVTGPEVRSLLSVSTEYEKVLMELVRENAHLSGRIAQLEKATNQMKQFWEQTRLERLASKDHKFSDYFFSHTTVRQEDGRYVIKLPSKPGFPTELQLRKLLMTLLNWQQYKYFFIGCTVENNGVPTSK
uniref:Uncharacterized protein n=1 Tax=Glossina palpalis gambiensis TaxID=67801 RepID=A0A1B0C5Q3_9MUSC